MTDPVRISNVIPQADGTGVAGSTGYAADAGHVHPGGAGVTALTVGPLVPLFTAAVTSPTTTPDVEFSLSAAAQNAVLAGPASGGPGAPAYRALAAVDLPRTGGATLASDPTLAHNTDPGETDLFTETAAVGILAVNGDAVTLEFAGSFVSTPSSTERLRVYAQTNLVFDSGPLTIAADAGWLVHLTAMRCGPFKLRVSLFMLAGGISAQPAPVMLDVNGMDFTAAVPFKITGEAAGAGAASSQILALMGHMVYVPVAAA